MIDWVTDPAGVKIRWKGLADIRETYRFMEKWLVDRDFGNKENLEKKYSEEITQGGKIIKATWIAEKKISNYFKYIIKVAFLLINVHEVEIPQGNIKRKIKKGDFEIKIYSYVESGNKDWDKMGVLKKIYYNFIVAKRLDEYKEDLYNKTYNFVNATKESLTMRTF